MFRTISIMTYAVLAYSLGMASLGLLFLWYGNLLPGNWQVMSSESYLESAVINFFLFLAFCIQHSVMARPAFKERWTRVIPSYLERSTFVLVSSLALFAVLLLWQPLGGTVWAIENQAFRCVIHTCYAVGWTIVVGSTFALSHADFFGLRQAYYAATNREYTPIGFSEPRMYQHVRHPLYVGLILLSWATPDMTPTHLGFALLLTSYILVAVRWEERDLVQAHGEKYRSYAARTPRLLPRFKVGKQSEPATLATTPATLKTDSGVFRA